MTSLGLDVKVVASQASSVLNFWLIWVQDQRVGRLDVVVNEIAGQDTSLALWKVEAWKLFLHTLWVGLGVINIEDTSGKSGTHFSSVVSVHS